MAADVRLQSPSASTGNGRRLRDPGTPIGGERPHARRGQSRTPRRHGSADDDGLDTIVRNLSLDESMVAPPPDPHPIPSQSRSSHDAGQAAPRLLCPVLGCAASHAAGPGGWRTMQRLRAHVDGHMIGTIPGRPPATWLAEHRLQACGHCGKSVSGTAAHAMHRRCWARVATADAARRDNGAQSQDQDFSPDLSLLSELPSIESICSRQVPTKEYLEPELLSLAEPAFLRCVANAARFVDKEAWCHLGTDDDTPWRKQCRVAWTELFMFSKTCLPQLPGGKAKAKRNLNIVSNRLARWRAGERLSLWNDMPAKYGKLSTPTTSEKHELKRK
jgi:hypothetical protein